MKHLNAYMFVVMFTLFASSAISAEKNSMLYKTIKDVPVEKWQNLSNKKIYFGHQSVGYNIVDGLDSIINENPDIKLNILETNKIGDFDKPVFAHSTIGENKKPILKINQFAELLDKKIAVNTDAAFLKLCYVDTIAETNIVEVFAAYKSKMEEVQNDYPALEIIHFTVPLRTSQQNWKTYIKELLGREIWGYSDNVRRNELNELIRKEYLGKSLVFDIARLESTLPDGSRQTFEKNDRSYYSLYPGYSSDGGHLNHVGAKYIAEHLLLFLVNNLP